MTINEMKQSYKQSYTDNVELSIFNCGHEVGGQAVLGRQ